MTQLTTGIVISTHVNTGRENIGDILSAEAIAKLLSRKSKIFILPRDAGVSKYLHVIYGGGGMIRPNFFVREVYGDYLLRKKNDYEIYGVGLNCDLLDPLFTRNDLSSLHDWIENANKITVRDILTKNFIEDKLKLKCLVAPCPTYTVLHDSLDHKTEKILFRIGITASFGHTATSRRFLSQTKKLIRDIAAKVGVQQVSIICHDEDDYRFSKKNFKGGFNICRPKTFTDVSSAYSKCESILTFRAHGVIFAAAVNRPCSPVIFSNKLKSLYEYHYQSSLIRLNFDARTHLKHFSRAVMPRKLD
ncbi:MAG: polysaccharide pyruvyl transferase family protein [Patescibacteria group bacterium]